MGNKVARPGDDLSNSSDDGAQGMQTRSSSSSNVMDLSNRLEELDLNSLEVSFNDLSFQSSVGSGSHGAVFKASFFNREVAVKKFDKSYFIGKNKTKLDDFLMELMAVGSLPSHENVITFVGFVSSPVAVVMELAGKSLPDVLFRQNTGKQALDWKQRLQIAVDVANGLSFLHRHGTVHGNIKTSNVLLQKAAKSSDESRYVAKLSDAGLGSIVTIMAHPAYASPQEIQTGFTDKSSDVYALGVLLCELLTGMSAYHDQPNPTEIHRKVASDPNFRPSYSDILQKPDLHKTQRQYIEIMRACWSHEPKKRPTSQDVAALLNDLLQQIVQPGYVSRFKLQPGLHRSVFTIPDKIYGRDIELQSLKDLFFSQFSQGQQSRCIVVGGASGIGKTTFIKQAFSELTSSLSLDLFSFHTGKFDRESTTPYSAVLSAFRSAIDTRILGPIEKNPKLLKNWKTALERSLGKNAQLIVDVLPVLTRVLGKDLPKLPTSASFEETVNRFLETFTAFSKNLTGQTHHLVLFIDDLHWADSQSLRLFEKLALSNPLIVLVLSYRDNEVADKPNHPMHKLIAALQKAPTVRVQPISLGAPSLSDMTHMCRDSLHALSDEEVLPLAQLIYKKSFGNPFYFRQLLSLLHQNRMIEFDEDSESWKYNLQSIQQLALTVSNDMLEIMLSKLRQLPTRSQQILKIASCIGSAFQFEVLLECCRKIPLEDGQLVGTITEMDLVECIDRNYLISTITDPKASSKKTYAFVHDRVHQAANSLWHDWEKTHSARVRLAIGRIMQQILAQDPNNADSVLTFDMTSHMNAGRSLLKSKEDIIELGQLNFQVAERSQSSTDFHRALEFARTGIELMLTRLLPAIAPDASSQEIAFKQLWNIPQCSSIITALLLMAQKLEYWYGSEEAGDRHFAHIKQYAISPLVTSQAFANKALKLELEGKFAIASTLLQSYFTGEEAETFLPARANEEIVEKLLSKVKEMFTKRDFKQISQAKIATSDGIPAPLVILLGLSSCGGFVLPPIQQLFILLRASELVLEQVEARIATSKDDSGCGGRFPPAMFSVLLRLAWNTVSKYSDFSFARLVAETCNAHPVTATIPDFVVNYNTHARQWTHPLKDIHRAMFEESLPLAVSTASRNYIAYHAVVGPICMYEAGKSFQSVLKKFDELKKLLTDSGLVVHLPALKTPKMLMLLDNPKEAETEFFELQSMIRTIPLPYLPTVGTLHDSMTVWIMLNGGNAAGRYTGRLADLLTWERLVELSNFAISRIIPTVIPLIVSVRLFTVDVVARCRLVTSLGGPSGPHADTAVKDHVTIINTRMQKLALFAKEMPANFAPFYNLAMAEKIRALKDDTSESVIKHYKEALDLANKGDMLNLSSLGYEALASFYKEQGPESMELAKQALLEARTFYRRFGALEKVREIEKDTLIASELLKEQQEQQQQQQQQQQTKSGGAAVIDKSSGANIAAADPYDFADWALLQATKNEQFRRLLEKHFASEYCVEPFYFLIKSCEYSSATSPAIRLSILQHIQTTFLTPNAPLEINITNEHRTAIRTVLQQVATQGQSMRILHDQVLKDIISSVRGDAVESLARFRNSGDCAVYLRMLRRQAKREV